MQWLRARLKLNQCGDRLAIAPGARQQGHINRVNSARALACTAKHQQGVNRTALESFVKTVTFFKRKSGCIMTVTRTGAYPAFVADDNGDRFVKYFDFQHGFFLGQNQGPARICKLFGVCLNLFNHQALER